MLLCEKELGATSLLALVKSLRALRLLPPPTVHFKVRVLAFALALWDLLGGLGLDGFDVGAGFLRGQGSFRSRFRC